jgi:dienelactone hydrolase
MSYQWIFKSVLSAALTVCLGLAGAASADDKESAAGGWGKFKVGSARIRIDLTDTANEHRPMDVLLFYPADETAHRSASPTFYASRLKGLPIIDPNNPNRWVRMSYAVEAEVARGGVPVDQHGPSFPLIVFSHPAMSDPQNIAPTLERLASHGYVIAAPWHEGDTQDDRIIDVINGLAKTKIIPCFDGGASPCLDAALQKAVQNRALDIAALIDAIPAYFGDRVDMERVGLFGQSRGVLTALAAAGGSTPFNIKAEPRIDAIMMLAIAMRSATVSADLGNVTVPSLFVAGKIDRNTPMAISVEAFDTVPTRQKGLVIFERAEHGVYSINRCAQMQAAGAVFQVEPRAIGEELVLENIMVSANSGTPLDYCRFDSFVNPVDIRPVLKTRFGIDVAPDNVPRQLDTVNAMRVVLELANTFFDAALVKRDQDDGGVHFKQYLLPEYLLKKEGAVVSYAETETPRGRSVACDDPDLISLDPSCAD